MNIALIILSGAWGGAEEFVYQLAKTLAQNGHQVSILANEEVIKYYEELEKEEVIKLINLGKIFKFKTLQRIPYVRAIIRHYTISKAYRRLINHLITKKYDVLHFNQPVVLLLAYNLLLSRKLSAVKKHSKTIYTAHGLDFELNRVSNTLFPKSIVKKIINSFDIITVPSKFTKEELKQNGIIANIRVIPNGINYNELSKIKNKNNRKITSGFHLVFPGGWKKVKGGNLVLKTASILKNSKYIKITMVGPGIKENWNEIINLIRYYHIEEIIDLKGFLPRKEYLKFLSFSHGLILPSKKEAFGIVFLEAMALGKPIIATNMGGIPEIVENGYNGYLCNSTPKELAKLIKVLYENPKIRRKIAHINPKRAKRFDWNTIGNRYVKIL